ncbi:MAG TPA: dTDP-4-dehydrorhamnose reductase [Allosphingosinicella sp.]|jgi:dTDP-4-dehydrorhamnose reductase
MDSLELWGGYECTVNRVGDAWFDQTPRSGHEDRIGDLALFAGLGIRSLRYPALWERISPDAPEMRDFRWTDERLEEIRRLGMNPILTLCHHGSGPHYTSLIDDSFAPGLAAHAAAVAARYPWVRDWTPVNEPLTTARFSALYGYWYPHTKDESLFWLALLNEIDATRLAMREIRRINPAARLIQTDDLGYCHATEPLQCEADFQNQRRWIGWDLLCGMVVPGHALWERIAGFGLETRLRAIAEDPCPPDVIGINHYLSSERLIDHRVELYPNRAVADRALGECAGLPLVDLDAIRNRDEGVLGLPALVEQAWQRYGRTIAITECHNGATREEQVRWFLEVWEGAEELRSRGVDLCAVTAWSLLGSHDWNRMVTRFVGHYETGVFDVRTGTPRPTLLAPVLAELAAGRMPVLPAIAGPGWWRRESRLIHAPRSDEAEYELAPRARQSGAPVPLIVVGDGSDLTRLAVRACEARGLYYTIFGDDAEALLDGATAWAVLDARDHDRLCGGGTSCRAGAEALARACAARRLPCAVIGGAPAWSPALGLPRLLEIRTGAMFAPWDRSARAVALLDALDADVPAKVDAAARWNGVYGPDLIDVVLDLLLDGVEGAVSVLPGERIGELEFARSLAAVADRDPALIVSTGTPAPAPLFQWRGPASYLPPLETMLERFVREARLARTDGELAVERREDDVRLEAAE